MIDNNSTRNVLETERQSFLDLLEDYLEIPMIILGLVWLVLTVIELTQGLSPFLEDITYFIWIIFIADFLIKFVVAPHKLSFLRGNLITMFALAVPALRVLRIARAARALRFLRVARGARLVRIVSTFNRGMRALGETLGRRGFGYVAALSFLVVILGGAGLYAFEYDPEGYVSDLGTAMWWSAMILTTMGSDYFPKSPEGRLLCLLLAIYGFAIFGYVTATVASFFVEREAVSADSDVASNSKLEELHKEIRLMREELKSLR